MYGSQDDYNTALQTRRRLLLYTAQRHRIAAMATMQLGRVRPFSGGCIAPRRVVRAGEQLYAIILIDIAHSREGGAARRCPAVGWLGVGVTGERTDRASTLALQARWPFALLLQLVILSSGLLSPASGSAASMGTTRTCSTASEYLLSIYAANSQLTGRSCSCSEAWTRLWLTLTRHLGSSLLPQWPRLLDGVSGISTIDRFDASEFPTRFGGQIRSFDDEG